MDFTTLKETPSQSDHLTVHAQSNGLPYHIFISQPTAAPPEEGFPVIYVLDGNAFFETLENTIRLQSRRAEKTGVPPAMVVGIGYPTKADFVPGRRFKDLTPPSPAGVEPPLKPNGEPWPDHGGADSFLAFIADELKPFIHEHYHASEQEILFGHSLGGLFSIYTLFKQPDTFSSYIASSPSIWWSNRIVLEFRDNFVKGLGTYLGEKKLFISFGGAEHDHIVTDARLLAQQLGALSKPELKTAFWEAAGENHLSVVPTTISRALRFSVE